MAECFSGIEIRHERRLCKVKGKLGYFHTWEHFSKPVEASPLKGGAPAGVISSTFGIVEFANPSKVARVYPYDIVFVDEENAMLGEMDNMINRKGE